MNSTTTADVFDIMGMVVILTRLEGDTYLTEQAGKLLALLTRWHEGEELDRVNVFHMGYFCRTLMLRTYDRDDDSNAIASDIGEAIPAAFNTQDDIEAQ